MADRTEKVTSLCGDVTITDEDVLSGDFMALLAKKGLPTIVKDGVVQADPRYWYRVRSDQRKGLHRYLWGRKRKDVGG